MISRGFAELREANPALSYSIILDMLSGINECVSTS
jgi:serine/threonine-protein kinase 24/25/MST4